MLAAMMLAVAAPIASAQIEADLRCLAVSTLVVGRLPEAQRGMAMVGAMYFLGRIDAQDAGFDYENALVSLLSDERRVASLLKVDATRCGALLQERGAVLQALGSALMKRGKQ